MWDRSERRRGSAKGQRIDNVFGPGSLKARRVNVEIQIPQGLGLPPSFIEGRAVLSELNPKGLYVFTAQPLSLRQDVEVRIAYPIPLSAFGKVSGCWPVEQSFRILSQQVFPYRVQIQFEFLNDGDAGAVREYCETLEGPRRNIRKKAA